MAGGEADKGGGVSPGHPRPPQSAAHKGADGETDNGGRFQPGNPGRPKGARNRATVAAESLLDGDAEAITRKAVEQAKEGDLTAIRLCMDRFCPPRKDRRIPFELPKLERATDASAAIGAIVAAVADGDLT